MRPDVGIPVDLPDQLAVQLQVQEFAALEIRQALDRDDLLAAVRIVRRCWLTLRFLVEHGRFDRLTDMRNRFEASLKEARRICLRELVRRLLLGLIPEDQAQATLRALSDSGADVFTEIDSVEAALCAA